MLRRSVRFARSASARSLLAAGAVLLAASSATAQDCSKPSIGQLPLNDFAGGTYHGVEGGLYPGATNECPAAHLDAGRAIARSIEPLGADGSPDSGGVIGVVSIGFSFCYSTFDALQDAVVGDGRLAPEVTLVNCADGQQNLDVIDDPGADYWTVTVPARLKRAGITAAQVQVAWFMDGVTTQYKPFPDHVDATADLWAAALRNLKSLFPNLRQCFLSSVHYQGYSITAPSSEPFYFEQGFAVREVIARQIAGDPALEYDASRGPVVAPWISWGPYLWTDGVEPRADGLRMYCSDYWTDGSHPNDVGSARLAEPLRHFLEADRACTRWSIVHGTAPAERIATVERIGSGTMGIRGEPRLSAIAPPTVPYDDPYALLARSARPRGHGLVVIGDALIPGGGAPFAGGSLYVDPITALPINFDVSGSGTLDLDPIPDDPALWTISYYAQLVVFDPAATDGKIALSGAIELRLGD